ncbi:uncharacterized protein LOC106178246 [Lingula anatina]|uniref:Uncharacterized protein LOC106178246 n=1 Tax=Lingula anatina TaxID=7574 RepID=A0A1S3K3H6_LINAN|nr:uncharacterized protein LOC106178246 [Lingula anatina]|eukprot:XP_013416816.1 uncharacterized protein LOC106178246 [Lingula anatina]
MGFLHTLREEFRVKKFGLRFSSHRCFYRCQWPIHPGIFLTYRVIVALYTLTWFLYTMLRSPFGGRGHFQLAYLTIWTYIALVIHLIWAANVAILCYCQSRTKQLSDGGKEDAIISRNDGQKETYDNPAYQTQEADDGAEPKGTPTLENGSNGSKELATDSTLPAVVITSPQSNTIEFTDTDTDLTRWFSKVSWVLFNILLAWAPIVTAIYYGALHKYILAYFDTLSYFPTSVYVTDLHLHGLNSLIVFIEIILAAFPIRILHFIYPLTYGIVYVIWSVIYWSVDPQNNVLYPGILDWNTPGTTVLVMIGVLVVIFVLQFIWFLVHRIKMFIFKRYCSSPL